MKQNPDQAMFIGAVKWFDNNKGFGILSLPSGEELFMHIRGFKISPDENLQPAQVIIGNRKLDPKRNSYIARDCHILNNSRDWKFVTSLLGKEDTILLRDQRKKEQPYNLMSLAAKQLLKGRTEEYIFDMISSNFDPSFEPPLFIKYAEFINETLTDVLGKTAAPPLLSRVFQYFGNNMTHEILFKVWKEKKFRYIGYQMDGDYEIPENVLNLNATEIDYEDLARISGYSFGKSFCSDFTRALFEDLETMEKEEINALIPFIDFLENEDQEYWYNIVRCHL